MLLSILMTGLSFREYQPLLNNLRGQVSLFPYEVELLYDIDSGERNVGVKRNNLLSSSKGSYVCYVDDDDTVADNYVSVLLQGCASGTDVVTFNLSYTDHRKDIKQVWRFGLQPRNILDRDQGLMTVNHLCCWKREIAKKVRHPTEITYKGDHLWFEPLVLSGIIKNQYHCNETLYYYTFNSKTTMAQREIDTAKSMKYFGDGIQCYKDTTGKIFIQNGCNRDTVIDEEGGIIPCTAEMRLYHTVIFDGYMKVSQNNGSVVEATPSFTAHPHKKRLYTRPINIQHKVIRKREVSPPMPSVNDLLTPDTKITAICVCVDYSDILALTLPYNRHHFEEVCIITSPDDTETQKWLDWAFANDDLVNWYATDAFYRDGAKFNKWLALEEGLDYLGREGWICLLDADVLWPKRALAQLLSIQPGYLYTPRRRMMPTLPKTAADIPPEHDWKRYPIHPNESEFAGYSQIFHADDSRLGPPPWHETNWTHAGGADSFFQLKWPNQFKIRPNFEVLHLGPSATNWMGRVSTRVDGSIPDGAEERHREMQTMFTRRRGRYGPGRFDPEKIKK